MVSLHKKSLLTDLVERSADVNMKFNFTPEKY